MEFNGETVAVGVVPGVCDDGSGFAEFPLGEFLSNHYPSEALLLGPLRADLSKRSATLQWFAASQG
jgi:hypothetical protein